MSRITRKSKKRLLKGGAVYLALTILFDAVYPTAALALTGGPSQPEVQSFAPVGTSDMVDLFSGDFKYNVPLLDVGGYPVNISYNSGIGMDQEASWVGLGWNINPGVINRSMRGLPDDFNGDVVTKEYNMRPNRTYGLNAGAGIELFGAEKLKVGINYSIGVRYNNYSGIGIEKSLNLSLSAGDKGKGPLSGGLGLTSSSDNGLTVQPSLSFQTKVANAGKADIGLGLSIGAPFNSRGGLQSLTISGSVSAQVANGSRAYDQVSERMEDGSASYSKGGSARFDFGMPTFTPQISMPMQNLSITANFKLGLEVWGLHPNFTLGGYYSSQKLAQNTISNPAYGYMNADEGVKHDNAMLDFNREKDGSFTPNTPSLPLTNFTYDIYSVSGQGIGGSYRPFRSDLGHVFDASGYSTSDGYALGAEVGLGNLFHAGADVSVNNVESRSGKWGSGNAAAARLTPRANTGNALYERYYFKEANEKSVDADPAFLAAAGGFEAQRFNLNQVSKFNTIAEAVMVNRHGASKAISSTNYRSKREKRNQGISTITRGEIASFGLKPDPDLYASAPSHHIGEITTTGTDGSRYVYGIAAYNKRQEETTFAVGAGLYGGGGYTGDCVSGLVTYNPGDNSTGNSLGLDNYYSNTIMPAYAHSYLLTAVLTPDYIDADNVRGPSDGDLGNYTLFHYTKIDDYKWRVPVQGNQATFNEGLRSDPQDNKANYIYGEKELWYLDSIVTKNYIAIFHTEARKDGFGVNGKDGGLNTSASKAMRLLRKISLYSRPDYKANGSNAVPIKEVHFEYDYSLCPNVPNNSGAPEVVNGTDLNQNKGKLTLKKIYFTYQKSNKARFSPYEFTYSAFNPQYNIKGYDRWGNYKPNDNAVCSALGNPSLIPTSEYPYVDQNKATADQYASAWSLREIYLPSGGKIMMDYESDDYAYVQNKRAMQMFKIIGVEDNSGNFSGGGEKSLSDLSNFNRKIFFALQPGYTNANDYFNGVSLLYFRFLMKIDNGKHEYVSGYAEIDSRGIDVPNNRGWIKLKGVKLNDNGAISNYSPIVKAAIQFTRLNKPEWAWGAEVQGEPNFGKDLLEAIINSSFVKNIAEAIQGPNLSVWTKGRCREAVMEKSWVRLNNPNMRKFGGGTRVRKIAMSDEWKGMTGNAENTFSYGQEYNYSLDDGTSAGVASYEPQLGGDENPWKQPVFFDTEKLLAPNDEHYMEEPFGESFFPSPSVGYSRVIVQNIQHAKVKRNATGKVVHEFYTARDFPTITERTDLVHKQEKDDPFSLNSIFQIDVRDYMTATQGFAIELNDMHGKPKSQHVYQEGQTTPITSVEYKYKSTPYLNGSFRLDNSATVLQNDGTVSNANIGVYFDFVSDMREETSQTNSVAVMANVDAFIIPPWPAPIPVPIVLPSMSKERTRFRSATSTKVIQRFGILEETVAKDLGSVVATKNMAYDAETGEVLLTRTTTNFNDAVYSFTYPAHWYYDGMGPAYRNIGFTKLSVPFNSGNAPVTNANLYFSEGDELALSNGTIGWVTSVTSSSITVVDKAGTPVNGTLHAKVIRSGRRNMQSTPMAMVTSLTNPLANIKSNIFENVLQAGATEFGNKWRTYCECFEQAGSGTNASTNPYILGIKGSWKPTRSYLYLSDRTQSNYNNNTNIRKDGVFTSFTPFYKLASSKWAVDEKNWTYTSEVTEFSPYGPELENRDALGRYSTATFGYNQSLATSVAANSRYQDIGFDNFEDYEFSPCADNHFKWNRTAVTVDKNESHTGTRSIKVSSGLPAVLTRQLAKCPPAGCRLSLLPIMEKAGTSIAIGNGTAPYVMDWEIISGSPTVEMNSSGTGVFVSSQEEWLLELTVIDANGCKIIKQFSSESPAQGTSNKR